MPKIIAVRRGGPPRPRAGHEPARRRRAGHARPEGPQRRARQEVGRPDHHQRRRLHRQGDRARGPLSRRSAPSWSRRSPRRPTTSPVTAPPPPPCWPGPWSARACATWPPAPTRCRSRRASRPRSTPRSASIHESANEVEDKSQIAQVAAISSADAEIGEMIAEAIDKVGKDGVITVEESQTFGMEMDLVEGMRFDKGYISPYFVTDPERMEAVARRPVHPAASGPRSPRCATWCPCSRRSCSRASRW